MYFKLSAREFEILEEKEAIISRLVSNQQHPPAHGANKKPLKPPILVVTQDGSHMTAVIQRDNSYDVQDEEAKSEKGSSSTTPALSKKARVVQLLRGFADYVRKRVSSVRPPTHDRNLNRHRRRLADGLALSVNGTMISTSCALTNGIDTATSWMFFNHPFVKELEETVSLKCDVRVLSGYEQIFNLVEALMQAQGED